MSAALYRRFGPEERNTDYDMCIQFTKEDLRRTATELQGKLHEIFMSKRKPDGLLGDHPAANFASAMRAISIWHGTRIEEHFSDWINRIPGWRAAHKKVVTIQENQREIDNLAWNDHLEVIFAIETKRVWENQDSGSNRDVKDTFKTNNSNAGHIVAQAWLPTNYAFRYLVFDVFGDTPRGKTGGPPIISGDKIVHIFGECLWRYIYWEKEVMKAAVLSEAGYPEQANEFSNRGFS